MHYFNLKIVSILLKRPVHQIQSFTDSVKQSLILHVPFPWRLLLNVLGEIRRAVNIIHCGSVTLFSLVVSGFSIRNTELTCHFLDRRSWNAPGRASVFYRNSRFNFRRRHRVNHTTRTCHFQISLKSILQF